MFKSGSPRISKMKTKATTKIDFGVKIMQDSKNVLRMTNADAIAFKAIDCTFLQMEETSEDLGGFADAEERAAWDAASDEVWDDDVDEA